MSSVLDDFLYAPEVLESFGAQRFVAAMLQVEAALARAQADHGLIPPEAAASIAGTCKVELFDAPKIVRDSVGAGSLAMPLVKSLRETVGLFNPAAVPYVHFGCTMQDLVDTTMALITRHVLALTKGYVQSCIDHLLRQGLEAQAAPLQRALQRLEHSAASALTVQLGGTLANRVQHGPEVQAHMARALELGVPLSPWDTHRDTWIALACEVALLVGSLGAVAAAQLRGAMSDDASPTCLAALAMARRTPQRIAGLLGSMPHAADRSLGFWQADQSDWTQLMMSAHASAWNMAQGLYPAASRSSERSRQSSDHQLRYE